MTFDDWYKENVLRGQDWQWDYKETYTYKMMSQVWDAAYDEGLKTREFYEDMAAKL